MQITLGILFLASAFMLFEKNCEAVNGLEAIPERVEIVFKNDKYIAEAFVNVRKYNRRGAYVINFGAVTKQQWVNNVTIDVIFYEYLHNEYKRSFVEMHFKYCDLVTKDEYVGAIMRNHGIKCPMDKGYNSIANATITFAEFPYVFPFEKCRAEIIITQEPSHEIMGKGFLYIAIKQSQEKKD